MGLLSVAIVGENSVTENRHWPVKCRQSLSHNGSLYDDVKVMLSGIFLLG